MTATGLEVTGGPATEAPAEPAEPEAPPEPPAPSDPGLAEQLLGPSANQHPEERPAEPVPTEEEAAERDAAASEAFYRSIYRPANNPGRLNVAARLTYSVLGSKDRQVGGRLGGLSVDVGQSWNRFGYAVTLTAMAGGVDLREGGSLRTAALLGGGPTVGLGRLALLQYGFLDLRLGYDFFYAPVRVSEAATETPAFVAPHGPRLVMQMGLMASPARARRFFHGFGAVVGYQPFIGSLGGGTMSFTNTLTFGISYWMG
ncbi:MAG TPA: hypothetical protein PKW35_00540 [Nannocystaceae bacterium]|nr:hypothetical protein [Nannocystaceae bacterium]